MNERPIIFSGRMIEAILDGMKTETRRIVKPQPEAGKPWKHGWTVDPDWVDLPSAFCPFGVPGDRLYVRESFGYVWPEECDDGLIYDGENWEHGRPITREECDVVFRATDPDFAWFDFDTGEPTSKHWKPSIHMPKSRARIWLEITAVQIARLQTLGFYAARAEGFRDALPVWAFHEYWDGLNADRGFKWDSDPFVWVIEFQKVKK